MNPDAIAVIGMAGRFPGAVDIAQFWRNLRGGVESVTFFDREELTGRGVAAALLDDPLYVRASALLDGVDMFDADFFGFTPREAELTDPQHRVFLECAWEAIEDSGYDPERYDGLIGVYASAGLSTYLIHCLLRRPDVLASAGALPLQLGNNKDYVPLRASYKLRLRGPSINVNTACSSSLVAVHLACQSLIDRQCDIALAGGVGIQVPQDQGYLYAPNGILSPDGHCRAFDARAQGTVSGNGAGIVALKRYADALADGDTIRAVILGSAINNDGGAKVGFTAPSVEGQARVIGEALAVADVDPVTIGYVEAHGTGTPLGDPIEVAALKEVFLAHTPRTRFCALGSVKTNVGHLDEAAGVAGLIKAVLSLQHAEIVPSLHFERANPELGLEDSPFYVPIRPLHWEAAGTPRRAAVSSFGLGGTNAHVVLEEGPALPASAPTRPWQLLLLSARTSTALDGQAAALADHLRATPDVPLADVAFTLEVGRKDFAQRALVLCRDVDEAVDVLRAPERQARAAASAVRRPLVFLFPGQGSQYPDMGLGLYRTEPVFRDWIDRSAELLLAQLGFDLRSVLYPPPAQAADAAVRLEQTAVAQPALFTVEYALAQLLLSWGIRPSAMSGHSIGEYVAACVAGVFSWEDALGLVAARGRLMQQMPAGAMLAVELAEDELAPLLDEGLELALANAPSLCVVAGASPAVAALEERAASGGVACRRLHTSHAFHSRAMDAALGPFVERVRHVPLHAPTLPYVSNLTGGWITGAEATDRYYWARHLRHTVRFSQGIQVLLRDDPVFLEVGPGTTLGALVKRHGGGHTVLAAMRHPHDPRDDSACLLDAVGRAWLAGAGAKPATLAGYGPRRRVPLPTYPFERRRFWIDPPADAAGEAPAKHAHRPATAAAPDPDLTGWFYVPTWTSRPAAPACPAESADDNGWLVFVDACGLGARVAERLRAAGRRVVTVSAGDAFARDGDSGFVLDLRRPDDYDRLLGEVAATGDVPRRIAHLWSVAPADGRPAQRWDDAQWLGFYSLLFLVQAANRHGHAERLSIRVVSSLLQQLAGDPPPCPERATLLGPVRVVPREFPGIDCCSIDVALSPSQRWEEGGCLDSIVAELLGPAVAPIVAIRGGAVWEQTFAAHPLPAPAARPVRLRERGTYLITGGLGSMGLALARWLATEAHARLVLIARTVLPPETEWDDWLHGAGTGALAAAAFDVTIQADLVESIESAAIAEAALTDVDSEARLRGLLHAFCAALIGRYFEECGVALVPSREYSRDDLHDRLKLRAPFARFVDFLLRSLAEDGIVEICGDRVAVMRAPGDPAEPRRAILSQYPRFHGVIELLEHCTGQYRRALSGEIPSISVLYPDGTSAWLDECGRDTPAYARDGAYVQTAAQLVAQLAARLGRLRILEVGGGSGALTRAIVQALGGRAVDYCFTDLGPSFVRRAEQEAAANGITGMRFGVLDISRDPQPQGYAAGGFDLVLGYNVVHATARLDESAAHLRRLLAPGGMLMLVETTRLRRWDEMVWGLTEGWWSFADTRRDSPLLALDAWEALLRRAGFDAVAGFPRGVAARRDSDVGLILARQPQQLAPAEPLSGGADAKIRAAIAAIRDVRRAGGEVHVVCADVTDETQVRAALTEARERFGPPDGVLHTAGVLGQGLIHTRTPADVSPVLAPKAVGLLVLEQILQEQGAAPDFLVLCSSLAAVAPIVGQVAYCAANSFLDAYAAYRTAIGTPAIAVDWGFWQELGMMEQAGLPAVQKRRILDEIRATGRSTAGVEAFRRILDSGPPPQILVSPDPLDRVLALAAGETATAPAPVGGARLPLYKHPWLDGSAVEAGGVEWYVAHFDTRQWLLDEHRPLGRAVLPGTAYLELARAALAAHGGDRPVQLSDVYFLAPLFVDDGERKEVRTIVRPREAGFEFVVVSRAAAGADEWIEHARGEAAFLRAAPPAALALAEVSRRCAALDIDVSDGAGHEFARRVGDFPPHWRSVERLRLGVGEGLATLKLAPTFAAETADLPLHPALADLATGLLSIVERFESGVPFHYQRVRLWRPLRDRVYSHLRAVPDPGPDEHTYDVTVVDDEGNVLLEVIGFTLRAVDAARTGAETTVPVAERNVCVEIERPGSLETLGLRQDRRRAPGPGEVEIEVAAAGLNFIEVLYALGMLPEPPGGNVAFGLECAGRIAAVGPGVAGLRPGDEVFGFAARAFSRFTTTPAATVAAKPGHLTLVEAATLPAAFTTAYYALITRGRLRRGERVLIHAAAGGVGLAAVNIAQWRGAEIYATAGTPAKREYLASLGIRHVFDSRSLDFAPQVLDATRGRGVDVVLNSLGGEFIAAGLSTLGRYGRFLELGKRDIFGDSALRLAPFEKHLAFIAIDVGPDLPEFATVWRQVVRQIGRQVWRPLPYREFPPDRLTEAFEYMARSHHIGKVVVAMAGADLACVGPRRSRGRPLDDILGRGAQSVSGASPAEKVRTETSASGVQTHRFNPTHARPALSTVYRSPTGETQSTVVDIWQELLGVSGIGVDDNFFELRGDSLLAAQVTARLYAAFQVKLPLSSVFDQPTAAGLAARIEQLRQSVRELERAPASVRGESEVEHEL